MARKKLTEWDARGLTDVAICQHFLDLMRLEISDDRKLSQLGIDSTQVYAVNPMLAYQISVEIRNLETQFKTVGLKQIEWGNNTLTFFLRVGCEVSRRLEQ